MGVRQYRSQKDLSTIWYGSTTTSRTVLGANAVTGGNVNALQPGNGYSYHTFTSPGSLTVTGTTRNCEVLVVAGGGAGSGGGGGAGGLIYRPSLTLSPGTYAVTVGAGGSGSSPSPQGTAGNSGTSSSISTLTAAGGGGGGQPSTPGVSDGRAGGSGGGGGGWAAGIARAGGAGNTPPTTPPQGNPGGSANANGPTYGAGGGGGAGAAGSNGTTGSQGAGGAGLQYPQFAGPLIGVPSLAPLNGFFAGGGGGFGPSGSASGGSGGGGSNSAGVTNSGGGGSAGNAGGPGIVIIRYLTTSSGPLGSITNPAGSAAQIYATGNRTDGIYYINLPTVGVTPVYCALSETFAGGGGWMLAMKATNGTTFSYTSNYWTTANTLSPTDLTRNNADAKYDVFNYYTASKFLAFFPQNSSGGTGPNNGGMTSGAGNGWHWLVEGQNSTCLSRFQTGAQIVSNPRDSGSSWIGSGFSAQGGFQTWNFNYTGNAAASVRWGFGWNNEGDQNSNDVSGGIGMSSGYGSFSAGDRIGCCQSTTGFNTSCRVEIWVQ